MASRDQRRAPRAVATPNTVAAKDHPGTPPMRRDARTPTVIVNPRTAREAPPTIDMTIMFLEIQFLIVATRSTVAAWRRFASV